MKAKDINFNPNDLFTYSDGDLYWKINKGRAQKDCKAGFIQHGYIQTMVSGKYYCNHRLIWQMFNGTIPDGMMIDHIDGNPANNHIDNLRIATRNQNQHNRKINKNNTSGVKGVTWHKSMNCWQAQIQANNQKRHLGYFNNVEDAKIVIDAARLQSHGEFSNYGVN